MPRPRTVKPALATATRLSIAGASLSTMATLARRTQPVPVAVTKLESRRLEKVWGRRDLPATFGPVAPTDEPVGEIWFEDRDRDDLPLLVKYLFTSEKLSVQVHPGDAMAKREGLKSGKDEAWVVLQAEPEAEIGIGLRERLSKTELRRAAVSGSIEQMVDWRAASAGDSYYSPAGTIHALGPGLVLVEVQQNVDVTYRLYDYGRPRELHLDRAVPAADPVPYEAPVQPRLMSNGREILVHGQAFVLERWTKPVVGTLSASADQPVWLIPLRGGGRLAADQFAAGEVWVAEGEAALTLDADGELLVAYCGAEVDEHLLR